MNDELNLDATPIKNKKSFKEIATSIVWAIFYLFIVVVLCLSGTLLFVRNYYSPVYIDGYSMQPTLNMNPSVNGKDVKDFGLVNTSQRIIDSIELYDIVTCYYPPELGEDDYNIPYTKGDEPREDASHKIKRVVALPGQTFQIIQNNFYFFDSQEDETGELVNLPFKRKTNDGSIGQINTLKITLAEDEYFVMGDNWTASKDCADYNHPIYKDNIVGVLIAIIGTCQVERLDNGKHKIINKQYHWPVFYK